MISGWRTRPIFSSTSGTFGNLEFEKYSALRNGHSAKKTWSFRLDFRRGETTARYLFFFGQASYAMRGSCSVTLHVAREEPANSFNYERLDNISSQNIPDVAEIGYDIHKERFVVRAPRKDRPRSDLSRTSLRDILLDIGLTEQYLASVGSLVAHVENRRDTLPRCATRGGLTGNLFS